MADYDPLTLRQYNATGKKLKAAYDALKSAAEGAEYFQAQDIIKARSALVRAAAAMRQQVCRVCNDNGNIRVGPGHYTACSHPDVPFIFDHDTNASVGINIPLPPHPLHPKQA